MTIPELCPGCGKPIQIQWLFCAYCEHPLRSPFDGRRDASLRQDTEVVASRKVALAVLGAVGLLFGLLPGISALLTAGDPRPLAVPVIGAIVLLGAATLVHLARNNGEITARGVRRIVVGALTLAGTLIVIGGFLLFAGAIFALVVCGIGGGRC
jgi:hypothetical protein